VGVALIRLGVAASHADALSNPRASLDDPFAYDRIFLGGRGDCWRAREVTAGRCHVAADLGQNGGVAGWRRAGSRKQRGAEKDGET
jgi:hypothetical protein